MSIVTEDPALSVPGRDPGRDPATRLKRQYEEAIIYVKERYKEIEQARKRARREYEDAAADLAASGLISVTRLAEELGLSRTQVDAAIRKSRRRRERREQGYDESS